MKEMKKLLLLLCICINLFVNSDTYSKPFVRRDIGGQPSRITQLNYPPLPIDVQNKVLGISATNNKEFAVDNLLYQSWGLANIGFFNLFTPLVQPINSTVKPCSKKIVVAIIDTGIDYTHLEVRDNLWINKGETGSLKNNSLTCSDKSCNGIDDDGNGFIDDVIGWDFVHEVPLPYDTHGHGTHIAGIIAGSSANGIGSSGVCPTASIMALKYYDNSGIGYNNLQNTVRAIHYAVNNGANIINYSGGGSDPSLAERIAIEDAQQHGVLFIAAAGNDGHNNDLQPYYPASYGIDNIISVASITKNDQLLPSSNFGHTVNVGAPGLSILSSLPGEKFGTMSGTSQATAFVTGTAALIASQLEGPFDYKKVKRLILEGAKPLKGNESFKILSSGLLYVPGSFEIIQAEKKTKKQK